MKEEPRGQFSPASLLISAGSAGKSSAPGPAPRLVRVWWGTQGPCDRPRSDEPEGNPILHRYRIQTRETTLVTYELVAETVEAARAWMATTVLPNVTRGLIAKARYSALSRIVCEPPDYTIESIERIG